MDQATIDQDKVNLEAATQQAKQAADNVIALTKKLAEDERELAKVSVLAELEAHAQTLESSVAEHVRSIMARLSALL